MRAADDRRLAINRANASFGKDGNPHQRKSFATSERERELVHQFVDELLMAAKTTTWRRVDP